MLFVHIYYMNFNLEINMQKVTGILSKNNILKDYQHQPISRSPPLQAGQIMINISSEQSVNLNDNVYSKPNPFKPKINVQDKASKQTFAPKVSSAGASVSPSHQLNYQTFSDFKNSPFGQTPSIHGSKFPDFNKMAYEIIVPQQTNLKKL